MVSIPYQEKIKFSRGYSHSSFYLPFEGVRFSRSKLMETYKNAAYSLVREETFLPMDNIYFLKKH